MYFSVLPVRKHSFVLQRNKQFLTRRSEHQSGRTFSEFGPVSTAVAAATTITVVNIRTYSGPGVLQSPFTCIVLLNPYNYPRRWKRILSPFYRRGKQGSVRWSDLSDVPLLCMQELDFKAGSICWHVTLKIFAPVDWNRCVADTVSVPPRCTLCRSELPQSLITHTPSLSPMVLFLPFAVTDEGDFTTLEQDNCCSAIHYSRLFHRTQLDFSGNHTFADLSLPHPASLAPA